MTNGVALVRSDSGKHKVSIEIDLVPSKVILTVTPKSPLGRRPCPLPLSISARRLKENLEDLVYKE